MIETILPREKKENDYAFDEETDGGRKFWDLKIERILDKSGNSYAGINGIIGNCIGGILYSDESIFKYFRIPIPFPTISSLSLFNRPANFKLLVDISRNKNVRINRNSLKYIEMMMIRSPNKSWNLKT